jgi:hypothetical protein
MFDTVWAKAIAKQGRNGVIITGQPGTGTYLHLQDEYRVRSIVFEGKTLFNYYLLVRLLQRKQVILFSPGGKTAYLFYHNEVYTASVETLAAHGIGVSLPNPIPSSNVLSGRYLISASGKSQRGSWSPVRAFQCRQLCPIPCDTGPGTRNGFLCSPVCRYGLATSSRKGTSYRSHISAHV